MQTISRLLPYLFVVGALLAVLFAARRARRLLFIRAAQGRIVRAVGRAPPELLREVGDVLARAKSTGHVVIAIEGGIAVLRTSGIDPNVEQRLRNVLGRFPLARLRTAPRVQ